MRLPAGWRSGGQSPFRATARRFGKQGSLLLAASLVLVAAGCSRRATLRPLPADATLLAFGDSLTYGTGAATGEAYPAVLSNQLGLEVVNAGVPGERIADGLRRLPSVLDRVQPRLVILCHGGNDLIARADRAAIEEPLRDMLRLLRERDIDVFLVAPPRPGLRLRAPPLYRDVAREFGVPIDEKTLSRVLGSRTLKSDTVHPNAEGYRQIAEAIADGIRSAQR